MKEFPNFCNLHDLKDDYFNKIKSKEKIIEELLVFKNEILKIEKKIREEKEEMNSFHQFNETYFLEKKIKIIENEIVNKRIEFVDTLIDTHLFKHVQQN